MPVRELARLLGVLGHAPLGREVAGELGEAAAILGGVDRVERVAEQRHAGRRERGREPQRRLSAERDGDADRLLELADVEHVRLDERLEVEPVGGVVVGRDRLRVRVDEHRLVAELAQRLRGVDAAVVELDRLPDPVRPAAEHDHRAPRRLRPLVLALVRDVVVRRPRLELAGARVDREPRRPAGRRRSCASRRSRAAGRRSTGGCPGRSSPRRAHSSSRSQRSGTGSAGARDELVVVRRERDRRRLAPVHRLQERLGERPPEPERLADGAHLGAEPRRRRAGTSRSRTAAP